MRGEEVDRADGVIGCGIIPAGAGRRDEGVGFGFVEEDHPRGCGEKGMLTAMAMSLRGSSPRVRGEGWRSAAVFATPRIIPAGAGRSGVFHFGMGPFGDHPRGCGEKVVSSPIKRVARGSSPRVRGEGLYLRRGRLWRGIIPAGAGRS